MWELWISLLGTHWFRLIAGSCFSCGLFSRAPEVKTGTYDFPADVFSLGMLSDQRACVPLSICFIVWHCLFAVCVPAYPYSQVSFSTKFWKANFPTTIMANKWLLYHHRTMYTDCATVFFSHLLVSVIIDAVPVLFLRTVRSIGRAVLPHRSKTSSYMRSSLSCRLPAFPKVKLILVHFSCLFVDYRAIGLHDQVLPR